MALFLAALHFYKKSRTANAKSEIEVERREEAEKVLVESEEVHKELAAATVEADADLVAELAVIKKEQVAVDKIATEPEGLADAWNEHLDAEDS